MGAPPQNLAEVDIDVGDSGRRPPSRSAWLIPLPWAGFVMLQTVIGVVWLDSRLAPIAVLVEQQKMRDDRIAELERRVEIVDQECRRYLWKGK